MNISEKKNIVIVGAGFGGVTAAIKLASGCASKKFKIMLIDKNPYQLYTPALYEIAAMPHENANAVALSHAITIALEDIASEKHIDFIQGELASLNREQKKITLKNGALVEYHSLILALGSETNYFNIPGLAEFALPLKNFNDGVILRNKMEKLIREKTGVLHIAVGGAGATGVELAAEFISFVCRLQKIYNKEQVCRVEVSLMEATGEILQGFSPWVVKKARLRLQQIGVHIKTNTRIVSVNAEEIKTEEESIHYDLLVWAGGISGPRILQSLGLPLNKKGQIEVNQYLEAAEDIFAIGDNASFTDQSQKPLPGNIPIAEGQARKTAKNILRAINGQTKKPYRARNKYPYILAVGKKYAIADIIVIRFAGFFGWLLKQLIELRYFLFILPLKKALPLWIYTIKTYSAND
ncbi:MAG: NAD(P)/FAD-dependent oxidoreductase [Candidatus Sungbacteria bacterium]|nr:NAD(P)/FAD-dependent oxidoreductase [Candidatus Sungbacteria bacterium]